MSWTEPNCTAVVERWNHWHFFAKCHSWVTGYTMSRQTLSSHLVFFTGPWISICRQMLFHHLVPCHLKRRFTTSLQRCWGIFPCKPGSAAGLRTTLPIKRFCHLSIRAMFDHPRLVRALQLRFNRIRTATAFPTQWWWWLWLQQNNAPSCTLELK